MFWEDKAVQTIYFDSRSNAEGLREFVQARRYLLR